MRRLIMSRLIWIYAVCKPIIIVCGSESVNLNVTNAITKHAFHNFPGLLNLPSKRTLSGQVSQGALEC